MAQRGAAKWTLREEMRSHEDPDVPESSLNTTFRVTVDGSSSIFVVQRIQRLLRVFDSTGRFVRTIGRSGDGPGEFKTITELGWLGDTLWVSDMVNRRVTFFRPNGRVLGTMAEPTEVVIDSSSRSLIGLLRGGTAVVSIAPLVAEPGDDNRSVNVGRPIRMELQTRQGKSIRPLATYHSSRDVAQLRFAGTALGGAALPQPFGDNPLVRLAPNGSEVVVLERKTATAGDSATFQLTRTDASGRQQSVLRFSYLPERVRRTHVDSVLRQYGTSLLLSAQKRGSRISEATFRDAARKAIIVPQYFPPVADFMVGADGTLWLQRNPRRDLWMIVDRDGRIAGEVQVPPGVQLRYARGEQVWAVAYDEDDVPTLVRYRIDKVGGK
jgi:hypothetical protein